jgi:hypothetical protein
MVQVTPKQMEAAKQIVIDNVANRYNPETRRDVRELNDYLAWLETRSAQEVCGITIDFESWKPAPIMRGHGCVTEIQVSVRKMLEQGQIIPIA